MQSLSHNISLLECEYSVINTARSALWSIFSSEKALTFGTQPINQRLLKGCLKKDQYFLNIQWSMT